MCSNVTFFIVKANSVISFLQLQLICKTARRHKVKSIGKYDDKRQIT